MQLAEAIFSLFRFLSLASAFLNLSPVFPLIRWFVSFYPKKATESSIRIFKLHFE